MRLCFQFLDHCDKLIKRDRLVVSVQTSVHSGIMNKMTLSKAYGMDVDEDISNKKIKTHPQDELTISEEIFFRRFKEDGPISEKACANASIFFWR